jgi:hypothetical protein
MKRRNVMRITGTTRATVDLTDNHRSHVSVIAARRA